MQMAFVRLDVSNQIQIEFSNRDHNKKKSVFTLYLTHESHNWHFYLLFCKSFLNFHNFTRYLRIIGGLLNETKGYMHCIKYYSCMV